MHKCNCEHTNHFGSGNAHRYLWATAGEHTLPFVGPICDECNRTCAESLKGTPWNAK